VNNHFVACDDGRRKCTSCDTKYSKNTGNSTLISHLSNKHKIQLVLSQEEEKVNASVPKIKHSRGTNDDKLSYYLNGLLMISKLLMWWRTRNLEGL
jgi:hypothetical protein